jgi:hypothetical protein
MHPASAIAPITNTAAALATRRPDPLPPIPLRFMPELVAAGLGAVNRGKVMA